MSESQSEGQRQAAAKENGPAQWILDIQTTLGCVNSNEVKTGSICRVPERIRAKDKGFSFRPQIVAMGPFHRATGSDLQIMEETKWRFTHRLLSRPTQNDLRLETVQRCSEAVKHIESIIRASHGEKIEMAAEELARMMLLDGCFFLEHLLLLAEHRTNPTPVDDPKTTLRLLTDLTLLENQIPFVVLTTLSRTLFTLQGAAQLQPRLASLDALSRQVHGEVKLSPENIAESLLKCNVAAVDFSKGVYHFLHLIHLCSPDPYQEDEHRKHPLQLQRCARKLQAFGITIKAAQTNDSQGNDDKPGTVASVLTEFVDKFEFKIVFNARQRELIIPTLHIKEATEVKWRNLIAWEQIGLSGIGYKFTSYAYFLKGLVCCVHDIKLLKHKGVIRVHKEMKDEDLLAMFQRITSGAEQMDSRYREVCKRLNRAKVNGAVGCCVLVLRTPWHYWRRFLEWLRRGAKFWLLSFVRIYLGTPWKIVGVVVGTIVLALTIMQTVYAARGQ